MIYLYKFNFSIRNTDLYFKWLTMHFETFFKFIRQKVRIYRYHRTEYVPVSSPTQTMADFYPLTRNYALFRLRQNFFDIMHLHTILSNK